MAGGIARSPAMYGIYKLGGFMEDLGLGKITGLTAAGFGFDTIDVAGIMRTGAMLGGAALGISQLASGLSNSFSANSMLAALGIGSGISSVNRGTGSSLLSGNRSGTSNSGSFSMGGSQGDIEKKSFDDATTNNSYTTGNENEVQLSTVNDNVVGIYEAIKIIKTKIENAATGNGFRVSPEDGSI